MTEHKKETEEERKKKRCVTIEDILLDGSITILDVCIIIFYISVIYAFLTVFGLFLSVVQGIPAPEDRESIIEYTVFSAKGWILPIEILVVGGIFRYVLLKISKIKIAKCKQKETGK